MVKREMISLMAGSSSSSSSSGSMGAVASLSCAMASVAMSLCIACFCASMAMDFIFEVDGIFDDSVLMVFACCKDVLTVEMDVVVRVIAAQRVLTARSSASIAWAARW